MYEKRKFYFCFVINFVLSNNCQYFSLDLFAKSHVFLLQLLRRASKHYRERERE